jgi:site-specific DNA-methyltransferase (cytosine-N4-specific)
MKCANERCENQARQPSGRGRPGEFCSEKCANLVRKRAQRARERRLITVTEFQGNAVTEIRNTIFQGDAFSVLKRLPDRCVQICVTSPPFFGLRSYLPDEHPGKPLEVGLENTPELYVDRLVGILHEVRRVLREDGVLWLNLGDSYAGSGKGGQPAMYSQHWQPIYAHKGAVYPGLAAKQLLGIPWRVALSLQADGGYLRADVIWHKVNCLPESVRDRPTKSHEYVFLFSKRRRYYYDQKAIEEPTKPSGSKAGQETQREKNRRSVWSLPTQMHPFAHCAMMSERLAELCILAGSRPGDLVCDPFMGAGTTALVALSHGREYLGIEINPEYILLANERLATVQCTSDTRCDPAGRPLYKKAMKTSTV